MGAPYLRPPPSLRLSRSFFSFPSPFSQSPPPAYHEKKYLPFSPRQLYAVVSDVESYPSFVPFCVGCRKITQPKVVGDKGRVEVDAKMTVGFMALKESYVSHVTCVPYELVQAKASSSTPLFKSLTTTWKFEPVLNKTAGASAAAPEDAPSTLVSLELAYEFSNPLHAQISGAFFGQVSKSMAQAFEDRCRALYGSGGRR
ncbi:dehydrase and lipid transport-domain-containing protein [Pterulicium gracile]|uniref:Dehydrase and lipid transport-domain-containing protein n=1 Tax=Pterulicium gracile TaxID=1884261 RepID=A0A5C3QU61_9AGAR|nr:dehydrase and lipid transport-domain-containing protein [Pterula gracilis]